MVFPNTPLPVQVELWVDGAWLDVTSDIRVADGIQIERGRPDEGSQADPGKCGLTFNNRAGRYSPRNPTSDLYGKIGRNTLARVSVPHGSTYLLMPGIEGATASTPDAAALGITGDIDIRVDVTLPNWPGLYGLASKYRITGDQRSWSLMVQDGYVQFYWSPDGTLGARQFVQSTERVSPPPTGRSAIRATLDVNNGASGWTATFYTAATLAGPWVQLGAPVTAAGTTSIFDGTAPVEINNLSITASALLGHVHALELRSGIGGSVVASPIFTAQTPGAASFADAQGNTWTMAGGAEITNRRVRFVGEISEWPSRWDVSGQDVFVPAEASGILRRLGQGQPALASALRRGLESASDLIAYWPCEDGFGSRQIASALPGVAAMKADPLPNFGGDESFLCSKPLPTVQNSSWSANLPAYTDTGQTQIRWLMHVAPTASADQGIMIAYGTGTCAQWRVAYESGGALSLKGFDGNGVQLFSSGNVGFAVDGKLIRVSMELTQNGANVDWRILTLEDVGGFVFSGTLSSRTVGRITQILMNSGGGLASGDNRVTLGHISMQNAISSIYDFRDQFNAYVGETAGARIARLCEEEGVPLVSRGYPDETMPMGPQARDTFLNLIGEAAAADGGILYEDRDRSGLAYVTRPALYNAASALTLDYDGGDVAPPLEPTEDDQRVRNDVTVSRKEGSSARFVLTDGPMSVQPPPLGIGRYDDSVELNVRDDSVLDDLASWMVHATTWDAQRYPQVTVDLHGAYTRIEDVATVDSGDRAVITNPPPWLPPGPVGILIEGYAEELGPFDWLWTASCVPSGPYDVAVYGVSRYDTAGSELASGITSGNTTLSVSTTSGPIWTTTDVPFDVMLGGERVTVTNVTGASSPQSFTVTRSANGIVKSHAAGTAVSLADPSVYAL